MLLRPNGLHLEVPFPIVSGFFGAKPIHGAEHFDTRRYFFASNFYSSPNQAKRELHKTKKSKNQKKIVHLRCIILDEEIYPDVANVQSFKEGKSLSRVCERMCSRGPEQLWRPPRLSKRREGERNTKEDGTSVGESHHGSDWMFNR